MDIRIYLFVLIIGGGLLFKAFGDSSKIRVVYIDLVVLALLLESCLRGLSVGSDTYSYSLLFQEAGQMQWHEIIGIMRDRYIGNVDDMDAGYLVFEKLAYSVSSNFNVFLFLCATCFFLPFQKLLRWSELNLNGLMLLFVLYVALFNPIAMSGTRKEIALGFSIMCFLNVVDKQYVKAVVWMLVGSTIHMSMLVFLLFPVVDFLAPRIKKIIHGISFFFIPVMIVFSSSVLLFMANVIENEHYQMYAGDPEGGGMTFVLLIETIFLACFMVFRARDLDKNQKLNHLYSMLPMATILVPLITNNGSMIRLSQYFHLYVLVLLPLLVERLFGDKKSVLPMAILMAILVILSLRTSMLGSHYYFFWNDVMTSAFIK